MGRSRTHESMAYVPTCLNIPYIQTYYGKKEESGQLYPPGGQLIKPIFWFLTGKSLRIIVRAMPPRPVRP